MKHRAKSPKSWGVVAFMVDCEEGPVAVACWMQLDPPFRVSIEIDSDPAENITPETWDRARRALGRPRHILVLDDDTAAEVRRAVPTDVAVVVGDHPRLREMLPTADPPPTCRRAQA